MLPFPLNLHNTVVRAVPCSPSCPAVFFDHTQSQRRASCLVLVHIKNRVNANERDEGVRTRALRTQAVSRPSDENRCWVTGVCEDIFTAVTAKPSTVRGAANGCKEQPATVVTATKNTCGGQGGCDVEASQTLRLHLCHIHRYSVC